MIHFENVTKKFRRHEVLKGVELTFERGHRVALVGSNGAGKTTLIRCLLGEYNCEGQVTVDGLNPRANRREVLSKVGFVPQLPPPPASPLNGDEGRRCHWSKSTCSKVGPLNRRRTCSPRLSVAFISR